METKYQVKLDGLKEQIKTPLRVLNKRIDHIDDLFMKGDCPTCKNTVGWVYDECNVCKQKLDWGAK